MPSGTGGDVPKLRVRLALSVALGAVMITSAIVPIAALAATATTITLTQPAATLSRAGSLHIDYSVTPAPTGQCGQVQFWEDVSAVPQLRGTTQTCTSSSSMDWSPDAYQLGSHTFYATFAGWDGTYDPSTSNGVTFEVVKADSTTSIVHPGAPAEAHNPVDLSAWVNSYKVQSGGSISFYRTGVSTALCTVDALTNTGEYACAAPAMSPGTYTYRAEFSGSADIAGSVSTNYSVTVVADQLHASGVGLNLTTFYPYIDNYKDTVLARGHRDEPASVTIKVYSPTGTVLNTKSIGLGSGAYSWAWNGRNSAGTIRAEGKYKITQTLKDAAGTTKTYTSYVTLSKKRYLRYSKTISLAGSSISAKGTTWMGTVVRNTTVGYTKIYAPYDTVSAAAAGWAFTLPTASVYESFYVRIYGRATGAGFGQIGAQSFSTCKYSSTGSWSDTCFGAWTNVAVTSGTTLHYYRTPNLSAGYRSGTHVRMLAETVGGTVYIYKAQLVVHYGILTY
jgi:hypothetical protein